MNQSLSDYYRLPAGTLGNAATAKTLMGESWFLQVRAKNRLLWAQLICRRARCPGTLIALMYPNLVHFDGSTVHLPFDIDEVIENLRRETYEKRLMPSLEKVSSHEWIRRAYYAVRTIASVRSPALQKVYFRDWKAGSFRVGLLISQWIHSMKRFLRLSMEATGIKRVPFIWFWPEGASNCLIMTHDVETGTGRDFTSQLMDIDESYGIKASFQVIPEKRYEVPDAVC